MARILAISSQVVYGPVGNTAAVPALQAMGHEVMQIPTILLSHHPGHGRPVVHRTPDDVFEQLLNSVAATGALGDCNAIMTGYFASAAQVRNIARLIRDTKPGLVLVDPVIGDHGNLYVPEEVASAIRDELLPLAVIATPNAFEAGWLTKTAVTQSSAAIIAARALGPPEVIVTSVAGSTAIETLLVTQGDVASHMSQRRTQVPNGTGDFLSGLYLAHRLSLPPGDAFTHTMATLDHAITMSADTPILAVAQALHKSTTV